MSAVLSDHRIAVVGATGAVGREVLAILAQRGVPGARVLALASDRSDGTHLPYGDHDVTVHALSRADFAGVRIAIFAADAEIARLHAPRAIDAGAVVIDNSSAFRLDPRVPLVVPEINGAAASASGGGSKGLIANPNCSAVILCLALEPLRRRFGVERVVVSTYQAVSGAGIAAMEELHEQAADVLHARAVRPRVFREPCAFNVFSHDSAMEVVSGVNGEERKIIDETRKIWSLPDLPVTPTCIRVGVMRAHAQSIVVTLSSPASVREAREAYEGFPGLGLVDDRENNTFPTPLKASGRDEVLVGRLRADPGVALDAHGRTRSIALFACGDQLRKGAALNAIQIAERVVAGSSG